MKDVKGHVQEFLDSLINRFPPLEANIFPENLSEYTQTWLHKGKKSGGGAIITRTIAQNQPEYNTFLLGLCDIKLNELSGRDATNNIEFLSADRDKYQPYELGAFAKEIGGQYKRQMVAGKNILAINTYTNKKNRVNVTTSVLTIIDYADRIVMLNNNNNDRRFGIKLAFVARGEEQLDFYKELCDLGTKQTQLSQKHMYRVEGLVSHTSDLCNNPEHYAAALAEAAAHA